MSRGTSSTQDLLAYDGELGRVGGVGGTGADGTLSGDGTTHDRI